MKADAVIGAGYGDEGKGYFTDFLSSQKVSSVAIRFNGGAQAGHTVTTPEGLSHVFGHFTSNLFLSNSSGYLSKYFQINPVVYLKELNQLNSLGIHPNMACHSDCYITTPFDMLINQWLETARGENRHGSCGLGIGETVERSEVASLPLCAKDCLDNVKLREKLLLIREYFKKRAIVLKLENNLERFNFVLQDSFIEKFIENVKTMNMSLMIGVDILKDDFFQGKEIVFEGAQGLMLDQTMGEFPYVTRSNTGLKNIVEFSVANGIKEINTVYATRCYKTRHGAGPLKWSGNSFPYENINDLTNVTNQYQGTIRYALLDLDILKEAVVKDLRSVATILAYDDIKLNIKIGITWLNISEMHSFYHQNSFLVKTTEDFIGYIKEIFGYETLNSYGKTRKDVH